MMENKELSFDEYIDRWRDQVTKSWESLPKETRRDLERSLGLFPGDAKGWRRLIDQAVEYTRYATGTKQKVVIVGTVNVGKSTLYNQLIQPQEDRAEVSAVPGTTRAVQRADAGIFSVYDTPGADAPGVVGEDEKERALDAAREADVLVILMDASHGVRATEKLLFDSLIPLKVPTLVVINKMDLVSKERDQVLGRAAASLGIPLEQLIPISAKSGQGIEKLLLAIVKREPGIVAALGAALPAYRWQLAQVTIGKAASTSAAIAATPLPFLDFIPLITVQALMVLGIARVYAYRITLARAKELVASFGIGVMGRTLFYELSKFGGPPGWLVAAGVAAGTTTAMGYAAAIWFERGEKLSREGFGKIAAAMGEALMERVRSAGSGRPSRKTLHQYVQNAVGSLDALRNSDEKEDDNTQEDN